LGNGASNRAVGAALRATGTAGLRRLGLRTWGPVSRWLPDLGRSDHLPFWRARLPAVLWTDTAEFRNPHYHRATDRPDTLDYGFLREVSSLLLAQLAPPSPPSPP
ncbi:MAG: M28 family peptidase, partial [Myxococcales bacterium]